MESLKRLWVQLFPSKPTMTPASLPPQIGKVIIVTGSTSGLGRALVEILYKTGATVYMAARSESKAKEAIETITTSPSTTTPGRLCYLHLDLADLRTVNPFVKTFLAQETRLHLLFNNAGVANTPLSHRTAQNLEPQLGINCVGPYLLTQLLAPILVSTALSPSTAPNTVRVIWTSSILVDALAPRSGIRPDDLHSPSADPTYNYALSKTGNWFLAARLAKQLQGQGVVSIVQNPGTLWTPIWDTVPRWVAWVSMVFYYPVDLGVCTLLWAGMSESVTVRDGGRYVIPWGRWHPYPRGDLLEAIQDKEDGEGDGGGSGYAKAFEEWCDEVTREFR